jgi:hypothetical protein
MKTIIINGQRELAELPEKWYTDGTEKSNEWKINVCYWNPACGIGSTRFVGTGIRKISNGNDSNEYFEDSGHTYITPSEFDRLVYQPWKESQKVELPETYMQLIKAMFDKKKKYTPTYQLLANHINACIQLTNIMNFANDAFKGDGEQWEVGFGSWIVDGAPHYNPIRFTSMEAAEWAYKTFPEIFKTYWNV